MVGNPYRYRAALRELDNRHATAGCLLSLLFAVPFAARYYNMALLMSAALTYVCLIVPISTGFVSGGAVIAKLRSAPTVMMAWATLDSAYWMEQIVLLFTWLHYLYLQLDAFQIMTNQVIFFMLAEKAFCPEQRLSCLYVLLFFTVLAYLKKSLQARQWTQLLHETNAADFIKLTTTFIIVRLGKGVAMSMVLLTFTMHFNHLEPSYTYVAVTALYFALTQCKYTGSEYVFQLVKGLELDVFEQLEEIWVPLFARGIAISLSALIMVPILHTNWLICLAAAYANIYVPWLLTYEQLWQRLLEQRAVLEKYRVATRQELEEKGSQCAICLEDMYFARVTPCHHIFHGHCLRRCLKEFNSCPLCKQII